MSVETKYNPFSCDYNNRQWDITTPCKLGRPYDKNIPLFKGNAIWDTGATISVMNLQVVDFLGLNPVSQENVYGIHGAGMANLYMVDIHLPNSSVHKSWVVFGLNFGKQALLIGMDIIGEGDFAICGGRFFSYCTPSRDRSVDFR